MDRLPTSLAQLFASLSPGAAETFAAPHWRRHFEARGVEGTFVLFDPARERYHVLDEARARRRFLPGSTFDIPAALVGLEVGSLSDEKEVFRWDGRPKPVASWERDQTLATGMREGAAWMFQQVARRTGKALMREWLDRLEYGNRDIAGGIDLFWLQGALRVSAMEQVAFLHRLAEGRLAATQRAQRLVREALAVERSRERTLYAKGEAVASGRDAVAWWVGWIERRGRPETFFAMNFAPGPKGALADCAALGRAILAEAGALPGGFPRA